MTLIATVADDCGHWLALSDVLLSVEASAFEKQIALPLASTAKAYQFKDHAISGLASKAVVLSPTTLALWAGKQIVAAAIIRRLREAVESGNTINLGDLIASLNLTKYEREGTSIILLSLVDGKLHRQGWQVMHGPVENGHAVFSGTGWFDLIANTVPSFAAEDPDPAMNFVRPWLARVAHCVAMEDLFQESLSYSYGGWHELTLPKSGQFYKWPYLVKFWRTSPETGLVSYPLLCSWYSQGRLVVARHTSGRNSSQTTSLHLILEDATNAGNTDFGQLMADFQQPEAQIHLVMNDRGRIRASIHPGNWDGFSVVATHYGLETSQDDNLDDFFSNRTPHGKIARPGEVDFHS